MSQDVLELLTYFIFAKIRSCMVQLYRLRFKRVLKDAIHQYGAELEKQNSDTNGFSHDLIHSGNQWKAP